MRGGGTRPGGARRAGGMPKRAAAASRPARVVCSRFSATLLQVIDVLHPGRPNVPHAEMQKELAEKYRAKGNCVFTFGMKTAFGGGKSTGFGLVYDSEAKAMAMEARYRLVRVRRAQRPAASTGSRATGLQARAAHTTLMWLTARCACHRTV